MSPPKVQPQSSTNRLPVKKPPFTKGELKAKIPAHCFIRSTFKSTSYLVADVLGVLTLYYLSTWISSFPEVFYYVLWPLYWIFQGGILTGLWVVAHECGHRAYSDSLLVCDTVGLIAHSVLLVPYHSWRISHAKHHRSTGDLDRDEAFVPQRLSEVRKNGTNENKGDLVLLIEMILVFTVGWWVYLSLHVTGRKYSQPTNHFNPKSPLFGPRDYWMIVLSDIGILIMIGLLIFWTYQTSFINVICIYGIPYMIVNFWLLLYTLLHHTDPKIPRYSSEHWDWMLGALTTVDRDYGWLWNTLHHDIGNTHVLHHLFSKIPHYHAKEASEAIKPILGEYYYESTESIPKALWNVCKTCQYVDDVNDSDIYWFAPSEK